VEKAAKKGCVKRVPFDRLRVNTFDKLRVDCHRIL